MQPRTWQNLGLGVAASFAVFGLSGIVAPQYAVREAFGLEPDVMGEAKTKKTEADTASTLLMLWQRGLGWEMGFVIVSRTVLCTADTLLIAKQKGAHEGLLASSGLVVWLVIGAGLLVYGSK